MAYVNFEMDVDGVVLVKTMELNREDIKMLKKDKATDIDDVEFDVVKMRYSLGKKSYTAKLSTKEKDDKMLVKLGNRGWSVKEEE